MRLELKSMSSLVEILAKRGVSQPDRAAYTFLSPTGEERLTYGHLDKQVRNVAASLQGQGYQAGDRILLLFPPGLAYVTAFLGCLRAGMVAVPLYPPARGKKLFQAGAVVADCKPAAALTVSGTEKLLAALFSGDPRFRDLPLRSVDQLTPGPAFQEPDITPETLVFLQYTSGSTGSPKGVMVTHGCLLANQQAIGEAFATSGEDICVSWLPLYHDMGLIGTVLHALYRGFHSILFSSVQFIRDPFSWLEVIARYRATLSGGPNFAYQLLVAKFDRERAAALDLSCWRVAFNGAEPVRAATLTRFAETFAQTGFRPEVSFPCYGMAEATLLITGPPPQRPPTIFHLDEAALAENRAIASPESKRALVGCGHVQPGHALYIVDPDNGVVCGENQVGEIWFSGPSVARGYWQQEERNSRDFGARLGEEGPFLRTGDLGFLHEGELFITGRLKDLIIIRGRNYYPQDLELTVERAHPALRPGCGAAFTIEDEAGERLVVAQEVARSALKNLDHEAVSAAIRTAVAERHELQVDAVVLLETGAVPKTSSGKIRRATCRSQYLAGDLKTVAENVLKRTTHTGSAVLPNRELLAAANASERRALLTEALRQLAAEALVLAPEAVDVTRPLIALGIDSLAAVSLQHRLETELAMTCDMGTLLAGASIADLVSASQPTGTEPSSDHDFDWPAGETQLSYNQRALWFLHRLEPDNAAYHVVLAVDVLSDLDAGALETAFDMLRQRHPALRTQFGERDMQPYQHLNDASEPYFSVSDADGWDEAKLDSFLEERAHLPFNLTRGPLMRVDLIRRAGKPDVLLLAFHHIAVDFWSLLVLMDELRLIYPAIAAGEAPPLLARPTTYPAYVAQQEDLVTGAMGTRCWDHWRMVLEKPLPELTLPADRPRPPRQSFRGGTLPFHLDGDLQAALQKQAQTADTTLYVTLLAAFSTWLHRSTNQDDILVGSPSAGRSTRYASTVGYFVNPIVTRSRFSAGLSFNTLLAETRVSVLQALAHDQLPFQVLVERLAPERDLSRSPIFQAMFILQKPHLLPEAAPLALNLGGARLELGNLDLVSRAVPRRAAQFDLTLSMAETSTGLAASIEYSSDLFDEATIAAMARSFGCLLRSLIEQPQTDLDRLSMLAAGERRALLTDFNRTASKYPKRQTLQALFAAQAEAHPDRPALVLEDQAVTYGQLAQRAASLANHLRRLGVTAETAVGVCLERGPEQIVAFLAVLQAGGAYVPLDPDFPSERSAQILADCRAPVLLTRPGLADGLTRENAPQMVFIDETQAKLAAPMPPVTVSSSSLAYIIYTSGSTGRPKGVAITHAGVTRLVFATNYIDYGNGGRGHITGQVCNTIFDVATAEIWGCLLHGGTLVTFPREAVLSPKRFARLIDEQNISMLHLPTAVFNHVAANQPDAFARVDTVVFAGEAAAGKLVAAVLEAGAPRLPAQLLRPH